MTRLLTILLGLMLAVAIAKLVYDVVARVFGG